METVETRIQNNLKDAEETLEFFFGIILQT